RNYINGPAHIYSGRTRQACTEKQIRSCAGKLIRRGSALTHMDSTRRSGCRLELSRDRSFRILIEPHRPRVDLVYKRTYCTRVYEEAHMFVEDRFVENCRAALKGENPQAAIREVVAQAVSEPAHILRALGEPQLAGVGTIYRASDLTIL